MHQVASKQSRFFLLNLLHSVFTHYTLFPLLGMVSSIIDQIRHRPDMQRNLKLVALAFAVLFITYYTGALDFLTSSHQRVTSHMEHIHTLSQSLSSHGCMAWDKAHVQARGECKQNPMYPPTPSETTPDGVRYRIAAITDLDEERSKVPGKHGKSWQSFFKKGHLYKHNNGKYDVKWKEQVTLQSSMNEKGRGFELSELCVFNSKLYTVDDRTGLVYIIHNDKAIPWVILNDGPGLVQKGFKSEWMTVKDGAMYIGGLGKEWTSRDGAFINYHPMFVKSIDQYGHVQHHNWTNVYIAARAELQIYWPGYMVHEAVAWSNIRRRWYFLPRRMSKLKYDDVTDERRGTNVLISCDEQFADWKHVFVGRLEPTHGFSSLKFIPGTDEEHIVALKSMEVDGVIKSFLMVFTIDGNVILDETHVDDNKFEGIEFI